MYIVKGQEKQREIYKEKNWFGLVPTGPGLVTPGLNEGLTESRVVR